MTTGAAATALSGLFSSSSFLAGSEVDASAGLASSAGLSSAAALSSSAGFSSVFSSFFSSVVFSADLERPWN